MLGGVACLALLPRLSGSRWSVLGSALAAVPVQLLALLGGLWILGLCLHTITLSSALPGLTRRRALLLSLTGSAVSNVLPLGGAAGVALNYRMSRTWGFTPSRIAAYTVVTNVCDVLAKLVLPAIVVPLVWLGLPLTGGLLRAVAGAAVLLPVVAGVLFAVLLHPWSAGRFGVRVERVRRQVAGTLMAAWRRLAAGMALYTVALFLLLAACLRVAGAGVDWRLVVVGFTVERIATLVNLTPGGLGVVEVSLAAALSLSPGADPAGVAAGVLLYRALTLGLEIPVGGVLLAGWTLRRRAMA